jgi:hypothetical protein
MRVFFEPQTDLRYLPISEITFDPRSRHELGVVLRGLQHIFTNKELNQRVRAFLQSALGGAHSRMGRPGMDHWEILVLGVVRHALKADYDQLHDLANHHRKLREILGVEPRSAFISVAEQKRYPLQTIKDNVGLLDEAVLVALNEVITGAGHNFAKKKTWPKGW